MLKVSTAVTDIVRSSEFALLGMKNECLNFSAYAGMIQEEVAEMTKKEVTKSSIVIALSRLAKEIKNEESILPEFTLQSLSTAPELFQARFGTGPTIHRKINSIRQELGVSGDYFLDVNYGLRYTTITGSSVHKQYILNELKPRRPRTLIGDLAAIQITTNEETYNTPNVMYSILKIISTQKINLESITSAANEITFVLKKNDVKRAFLLLHDEFIS